MLPPRDVDLSVAGFQRGHRRRPRPADAHVQLRASLDLARLYSGREGEARDLLAPALAGFTETPELPEIGEAQRLLASVDA